MSLGASPIGTPPQPAGSFVWEGDVTTECVGDLYQMTNEDLTTEAHFPLSYWILIIVIIVGITTLFQSFLADRLVEKGKSFLDLCDEEFEKESRFWRKQIQKGGKAYYALIAQRIRAARAQRGLSQKDLGEMIGKSRPQISSMENNRSRPPIHVMVAIADAFGVDINEFLSIPDNDS